MKIAICDDEAFWINELQILLKEYYITRHIPNGKSKWN